MRLAIFDLIVFSALFASGCSEQSPITETKFIDIYVNLQLINAECGNNTTLQESRADSLMRSYGVTTALLDSTISWYNKRPSLWNGILAEANRRLMVMRNSHLRHPR